VPVPVATRSKAWVCGRWPAGVAGSNANGGIDIRLLWVLCVVRYSNVCRVDHSYRGVLSSVACLSVIAKPSKRRPWPGIGSSATKVVYICCLETDIWQFGCRTKFEVRRILFPKSLWLSPNRHGVTCTSQKTRLFNCAVPFEQFTPGLLLLLVKDRLQHYPMEHESQNIKWHSAKISVITLCLFGSAYSGIIALPEVHVDRLSRAPNPGLLGSCHSGCLHFRGCNEFIGSWQCACFWTINYGQKQWW